MKPSLQERLVPIFIVVAPKTRGWQPSFPLHYSDFLQVFPSSWMSKRNAFILMAFNIHFFSRLVKKVWLLSEVRVTMASWVGMALHKQT
ncbi:hypothetical protein A9E81_00790 [Legionella pneumophila]|nr:hypothetical protein A9E97_00790 [Legionella pneumophila]AOU06268.1 hypothetical protein A9E98_00790 [Legionella pneumophila]AOU09272.1 hypothetical protein A9F03_00975 [Legionella pneumophila]AOU12228.1 hypothetical protein A9E99_00790 [Legionella pneumophila]AOU15196.1 hypothetical protein A9F00_00975 [Legionella pneumophila]